MTFASDTAMVDPNVTASDKERTRRRRIRLAAAAAAIALAAGAGGWVVMDRTPEPNGAQLPAVVLGESLQPLAVYAMDDAQQVGTEPVALLHVRFAMIRQGPGRTNWDLTIVAPDEARSAISTLTGRHYVVFFDGSRYPLGLSYPAEFDGEAVNFFVLLPSLAVASALAESVTTSVVAGPAMGGG